MSKKSKRRVIVVVLAVVGLVLVGSLVAYLMGAFEGGDKYDYDYEVGSVYPEAAETSYLSAPLGVGEFADDSSFVGSPADSKLADTRMIIRTGSLSMVVDDVREAIKAISAYASEKGGFVVSSNVSKYDLSVSGDITLRIPADLFDEGVIYVKEMGNVESESVYGQDVTEEFVDLEAQLGNYKAAEEQFLEIMNRAVKIEDVLAVQNELTNVRANIERTEGRMKYLKESSALSTLTVYLSTDPVTLPVIDGDQWKPFAVVKNAARSLIEVGKGLVDVLIWIVIYIPVWIVGFLILWGLGKLGKKAFKALWG